MLLRTILMAALMVIAPLAMSPASASAQERGRDRAAVATANAPADACPSAMPQGIAQRGGDLPAGLTRCFPQTAPAPEPEPEPEPPAEECSTAPTLVFVNGVPMLRDCNGNLTPYPGM